VSNQDQNAAALSEFWNSDAPMSQVRENLNPVNGWYDLFIEKLEPQMDDNGLVFLLGTFKLLAPADYVKGNPAASHRERFYIGTKKDPEAKLPETRLNSPGFSRLKGIARVCDVPTNDQKVATLAAALLGKSFTNRIETAKVKDKVTGADREYCNLGRNPVKLGTVPAKLDGSTSGPAAANGAAPAATAAAASAPAGVAFGNE
jgi:hypothetical protein